MYFTTVKTKFKENKKKKVVCSMHTCLRAHISQKRTGHFLLPVCLKKKKKNGEGIILHILLNNLFSCLTHLRAYYG